MEEIGWISKNYIDIFVALTVSFMEVISWISKNYIEIFGALAGVVYVFLEIRQNILLWPVGIVTSAVYLWVFFTGRLYAEMSLQAYYLVISIIGWYWWGKQIREKPRTASLSSGSQSRDKRRVSGDAGGELRTAGEGVGREIHDRSSWTEDRKAERLRDPEAEEPVNTETGRPGEEKVKGIEVVEAKKLEVSRITSGLAVILVIILLVICTAIWYVLDRFTDSPVPLWDSFITSFSVIATWMLARKIYEHWYLWIIANSAAFVLFFTRGLYPTMVLYIIYLIMSFAGLAAWKKSLRAGS